MGLDQGNPVKMAQFFPRSLVLGCPGQEVRIKGERINGLFHLPINGVFLGVK